MSLGQGGLKSPRLAYFAKGPNVLVGHPLMQGGPVKILIVEDNSNDRDLLMHLLESRFKQEAKFREAGDLKTALRFLERGDIDCVVLDLQLPDSTGKDTFLALHERYPHLPTVVITHNHDRELALDMVQSGAADYLIRNYTNEEEIFRRIVFAVERKRRGVVLSPDKLFASQRVSPDAETKRPHRLPSIHVPEVGPKLKRPTPARDDAPNVVSMRPAEGRASTDPVEHEPATAETAAELARTIQDRLEGALTVLEAASDRKHLAARVLEVLSMEITEGVQAEDSFKSTASLILSRQAVLENRIDGLTTRLDLAVGVLLFVLVSSTVFFVLNGAS